MSIQGISSAEAIFGNQSSIPQAPTVGAEVGSQSTGTNDPFPLRIITHNIRYATKSLLNNEKPWAERKPLIINELLYLTRFLDGVSASTSFICLQEVLHSQLSDILGALNAEAAHDGIGITNREPTEGTKWAHIGVGRTDGKEKGEYSPILYPIRSFKLLHFESKWLSPTPHKPSKGWDAGIERILTIGVFEHRQTGKRFIASNTHLDHAGSVARKKSVDIILDTLEEVRRQWDASDNPAEDLKKGLQYFLAGDFNSFPDQEAYQAMANSGNVADVHDFVPDSQRFGDDHTFTGFEPWTDRNKNDIGRIDFVWLGPKDCVVGQVVAGNTNAAKWSVQGYAVLPNVFDAGVFGSDHRAVVADTIMLP